MSELGLGRTVEIVRLTDIGGRKNILLLHQTDEVRFGDRWSDGPFCYRTSAGW